MIDVSKQLKEKYPRVLVVDDDMMNIEVLGAMLFNKKIDIDFAMKGTEALRLIQERLELIYRGETTMYKVILLDYSMPEMDGPQLAVEIQKLLDSSILFDNKDKPFICCCTAYYEAVFRRQAKLAGMDRFLTKPIEKKDLNEIVEKVNS